MKVVLFVALLCAVASANPVRRYDDAKVLSCNLTMDRRDSFDALKEAHMLDTWGQHANGVIDIMVETTEQEKAVRQFFAIEGCKMIIPNVQTVLDGWMKDRASENDTTTYGADEWYATYHNLQQTWDWWRNLCLNNPAVATWIPSIGRTVSGKDIPAVEIVGQVGRPWFYMQCLIHSREWVAGPTCSYVIEKLLAENAAGQAPATTIMNTFNFAIVPVVNADGYEWTWSSDRLWRKNRRVNSGTLCTSSTSTSMCCGVDLNRNYNAVWNQAQGASTQPCQETYKGPSVASEPETQAIQNYISQLQSKAIISASFDWHSYSQLVLRPNGYVSTTTVNEPQLSAMGTDYRNAIAAASGKNYISQTSYQLYVTSGTMVDYMYSGVGVYANNGNNRVASYTVELRPAEGTPNGFQLPDVEILPCGQENYAGFKALAADLAAYPGAKLPNLG